MRHPLIQPRLSLNVTLQCLYRTSIRRLPKRSRAVTHLRSEVYDYMRHGWLAPGGERALSQEAIEHHIADAKKKLDK